MNNDDSAETWILDDGSKLALRHIAPADAAREQSFIRGLSPQSRYLRFQDTIKELSKKDLKKFTDPDSRNTVTLIVLHSGETGEEEIGVARYVIDPDGCVEKCGFGRHFQGAAVLELFVVRERRPRGASWMKLIRRRPDDSTG